jgi:RHS repeat-associated protein
VDPPPGFKTFRAVRSTNGTLSTSMLFTGQQLDVASELYYLRARYYDPESGRFLTRDSFRGWFASPQSQNPYAYVTNNPVFYVDPLGLWGLGDLADAAGGISDALGNAADTFGDALGDLELDDLGYIDLNGTVCLGLCLTGGLQASFGEGLHPYVGGGIGTPQLAGNVTVAPGQHITTGWNCGFQVSMGPGTGPTVQVGGAGFNIDKEGRPGWKSAFVELGVSAAFAPPGLGWSNTCMYVF